MSATDELRLLLDERGVEWWKPYDATESEDRWTHWRGGDGEVVTALEFGGGRVALSMTLEPEQAIGATMASDGVGRTNDGVAERGTCHMERTDWDDGTCTWGCICSACGKKFEHETGRGWHYCPKCGREVVE